MLKKDNTGNGTRAVSGIWLEMIRTVLSRVAPWSERLRVKNLMAALLLLLAVAACGRPLGHDGESPLAGPVMALVADADGDTIPDSLEGTGDFDRDTIPNYQDLDSDGDTIKDAYEAGDADLNTPPKDHDGDGDPDYLDLDSDNDTIPDKVEAGDTDGSTPPINTDNDALPDFLDPDSDDDGVPDKVEAGDADPATPPVDTDGDGLPDYRDSDSDNDGIPDGIDNCRLAPNPGQKDTNGNHIGDACDPHLVTFGGSCAVGGRPGRSAWLLAILFAAILLIFRRRSRERRPS